MLSPWCPASLARAPHATPLQAHVTQPCPFTGIHLLQRFPKRHVSSSSPSGTKCFKMASQVLCFSPSPNYSISLQSAFISFPRGNNCLSFPLSRPFQLRNEPWPSHAPVLFHPFTSSCNHCKQHSRNFSKLLKISYSFPMATFPTIFQ